MNPLTTTIDASDISPEDFDREHLYIGKGEDGIVSDEFVPAAPWHVDKVECTLLDDPEDDASSPPRVASPAVQQGPNTPGGGLVDPLVAQSAPAQGASCHHAPSARSNMKITTRSGRDVEAMLVLDFETTPDETRGGELGEKFGLPPVEEPRPSTPFADCPDCNEVLKLTVDKLKDKLRELQPDDEWLMCLDVAEEGRDKPRKGILDAIEKFRKDREAKLSAREERIRLLSTTPEYCSICAAAFSVGNGRARGFIVGEDGTERDLIEMAWNAIERARPIVGWHIIGFDLPVLLVRSMILGVTPTRQLDLSPYGGNKDVVDLYLRRFGTRGSGGNGTGKLKEMAPLLGVSVPAGDCEGSQVYRMWKEGDRAGIRKYVCSDVDVARDVAFAMAGYFWN